MRSRPIFFVAFVVLALSLVGIGCTDDDEPTARPADPLEQIQQATFAARSAAYRGQTVFADGSTAPIDGVSQAEPPAGEVRYPVQTTRGPQEVTALWVDGSLYLQRAVTDDPDAVSPTLRHESDPPWLAADVRTLARALLDLSRRFGVQSEEGIHVVHDLTQEELAQLVGASRETVNKALADFAQRGWLRLEARAVILLDVERLAKRSR